MSRRGQDDYPDASWPEANDDVWTHRPQGGNLTEPLPDLSDYPAASLDELYAWRSAPWHDADTHPLARQPRQWDEEAWYVPPPSPHLARRSAGAFRQPEPRGVQTARRRQRLSLGGAITAIALLAALAFGLIHGHPFSAHAEVGAPTSVAVTWGDSTGLARWPAVPGASAYLVTLIRVADQGVMAQSTVPASQLAADVQGIWYGKQYQVAVQAIDANGTLGAATLSAAGTAQPISRKTYNGFLDQANRSAGALDPRLWDLHIYDSYETNYGAAFTNNQLHYQLEAGNPNGHQTVTVMRARVPVDWTNRTATIHGEVDLKGTFHNWFGAVLSPQATGPDRIMDRQDRGYNPRTMPQLELFDDQDGLHLLYAVGDHSAPRELAAVPNPTGYSNVRDELIWRVSRTHVTVELNGKAAMNVALPVPLAFTHGYLTLAAEDYPDASSGLHTPTTCDAVLAPCNVWHLDNWGFDAASGKQPASAVYYANGCGPFTVGADSHQAASAECGQVRGTGTATVNVTSTAGLAHAALSFEAMNPGSVAISVNGGPWQSPTYLATDANQYTAQDYIVPLAPSKLRRGANVIRYKLGGGASAFNTEIETLARTPYVPPAEPAEPAPQGTWGSDSKPTPVPTRPPRATATPVPTRSPHAAATPTAPAPSPIAITSVPCTVAVNGKLLTGTCSGTFVPGAPVPHVTATPPHATATPVPRATATPPVSPSPAASSAAQAGAAPRTSG